MKVTDAPPFASSDTIQIFMSKNIEESMVVTAVFNPSLPLRFGGSTTALTVKYNASSGSFVQA